MLAARNLRVTSAPKPHVLFVLADDLGHNNLGYSAVKEAQPFAHSPNLDALVADGVKLDRYYTYHICSPSRSSFQSGRLPVHVNLRNVGVLHLNRNDPLSGAAGVPRNMTTIAQVMSRAGYSTHFVGKWDAGMATPRHTPRGRGYDSSLFYFQHANDEWAKSMGSGLTGIATTGALDICLNGDSAATPAGPGVTFRDFSEHNATYAGGVRDPAALSAACADSDDPMPPCFEDVLFKERSLRIVGAHDAAAAPLFLVHATRLVHTPLQVPKYWLGRVDALAAPAAFDDAGRRTYAAMVLMLDAIVGELVGAIKAKPGMWDKTLVGFASDNGGPIYRPGSGNNHPLKGGKFNSYEGGVRVLAFVSGGFVPPARRGAALSHLFSVADWYGTFATLAGEDTYDAEANATNAELARRGLPLLPPVDAVDHSAAILNGSAAAARTELHLSASAILVQRGTSLYKLVVGEQIYSAYTGPIYPNCSAGNATYDKVGVAQPVFTGLKVLGEQVNFSKSRADEDRMLWLRDAGAGELYDVAADPTEHVELGAAQPTLLAELQALLTKRNLGLFDPDRGAESIAACYEGLRNGGYYGPFVDVGDYYSPVPPPTPAQKVAQEKFNATIQRQNRPAEKAAIVAAVRAVVTDADGAFWKKIDQCL